MPRPPFRVLSALVAAVTLTALPVLAACSDGGERPASSASGSGSAALSGSSSSGSAAASASGAAALTVSGSEQACAPSRPGVPAGEVRLRFANGGTSSSGVRVIGPDGVVEGQLTYVQPGSAAELPLDLPAGSYTVECTPGMVRRAIRVELVVGTSAGLDPRLVAAVAAYRSWVTAQAAQSLRTTRAMAAAIAAGDVARARRLYPESRVGWERIEPVAEAFGDLDPKIDARLADLEAGQPWTGWHVIERALFEGGTTAGLSGVANALVGDLGELAGRLPTAPISVTSMAAGALQLLDEVSRTKVTGEEEIFSHTDLVDVQANVAGSRQVVALFRPVLAERDAALLAQVERGLAQVQARLDALRTGPGDTAFRSYAAVDAAARRELSDAVDAASEPVSRLSGALTRPSG